MNGYDEIPDDLTCQDIIDRMDFALVHLERAIPNETLRKGVKRALLSAREAASRRITASQSPLGLEVVYPLLMAQGVKEIVGDEAEEASNV